MRGAVPGLRRDRRCRHGATLSNVFDLPAGDYFFACWETGTQSGGTDGPPHASIGMVYTFTVTALGSVEPAPTDPAKPRSLRRAGGCPAPVGLCAGGDLAAVAGRAHAVPRHHGPRLCPSSSVSRGCSSGASSATGGATRHPSAADGRGIVVARRVLRDPRLYRRRPLPVRRDGR